jgi:hypothetical protein
VEALLHKKYLYNKTLMRVKDDFFQRAPFVVVNGHLTRFWEDTWLGQTPLADQYPSLYSIVRRRNVLVSDVLANNPLNVEFRRILSDVKWDAWIHLVQRLLSINLNDEEDKFVWKLSDSGSFSVKSMYTDIMNGHTVYLKKYIWKLKVPLKIRIFMWFLQQKVILTKDNLSKRNWHGCKKCAFCDHEESINHLFFDCPFARLVWGVVLCTFNISPPTNCTNMFGN